MALLNRNCLEKSSESSFQGTMLKSHHKQKVEGIAKCNFIYGGIGASNELGEKQFQIE